jgi:hypothetical protein
MLVTVLGIPNLNLFSRLPTVEEKFPGRSAIHLALADAFSEQTDLFQYWNGSGYTVHQDRRKDHRILPVDRQTKYICDLESKLRFAVLDIPYV